MWGVTEQVLSPFRTLRTSRQDVMLAAEGHVSDLTDIWGGDPVRLPGLRHECFHVWDTLCWGIGRFALLLERKALIR